MRSLPSLLLACTPLLLQAAPEPVGPFFEPTFPFVQSAVELAAPNNSASKTPSPRTIVRGILVSAGEGSWVLFDQELLGLAAWIRPPANQPPISLRSMAQMSYAEPHRKAGTALPAPSSAPLFCSFQGPGVGASETMLQADPRPSHGKAEQGRGPLPAAHWRFEGIELKGSQASLHYRFKEVALTEHYQAIGTTLQRALHVSPHSDPLYLAVAGPDPKGPWVLDSSQLAQQGTLCVQILPPPRTTSPAQPTGPQPRLILSSQVGLALYIPPSSTPQLLHLHYHCAPSPTSRSPFPPPAPSASLRWPQTLSTQTHPSTAASHGLLFDEIALPLANPWARRVRPADLAFLDTDRAALLTYDGDVWLLSGLSKPWPTPILWRRFASGLNEPLSMACLQGVLQVHTRNGLVRLHDRSGSGEADWYENFSDCWIQGSSTRAFALDMAVAPDGSTYLSQGGIFPGKNTSSPAQGASPFSGAITQISPDGRSARILSRSAREPFLAVHPRTGTVTATDQQGDFIPSSVCYHVRAGSNFGFGQANPSNLTPPLVWIPHHVDNSCASQVWLEGQGMGPLAGRLLHLSYGRGIPLIVCPDLDAPTPQGAIIPLEIPTQVPLLHARMHPQGDSLYLAGFQIYDSRASQNWGLGRLRLSSDPLPFPIDAKSCKDGVLLSFASPLDPASVSQENVFAAGWNYLRSKQYGSARYKRSGELGIDPLPIGQVLLASDAKTVFVHLPELPALMQLEIEHAFRLSNGTPAKGSVYFTIHQARELDLRAAGFPHLDLSRSVPIVRLPQSAPPSLAQGKELSVTMGCIACHSVDGSTEGKTGPTWKGLFGKNRTFTDGSMESANEFYLRTSILEPQKKIVSGYHPGMASYQGILNESQIDSIILYIRSLK